MGNQSLIEHVVVVMLENRSFDHYLGALNFDAAYPHRDDVDGLRNAAIPNHTLDGVEVPAYCMDGMTLRIDDPPHEWSEVQAQRNGGKLDQFVTTYQRHYLDKGKPLSEPEARRVMGYYSRITLPVMYELADQFAVCDRWYSSFLGSTWPNRLFLHAGHCGETIETKPRMALKARPRPVWESWEKANSHGDKITWRVYGADFSTLLLWPRFLAKHGRETECIPAFKDHCAKDKLAAVSIVEPPYSRADDHPEHQPQRGQAFIKYIVEAVARSPAWEKTAILITYDEHGGFFDHVDPPPRSGSTDTLFSRLGFRVPTVVVSPYTPSGVVHQQFDHTSFITSIAERWGLDLPPGVTGKPFWNDCFDFDRPARPGTDVVFPELEGRDQPLDDALVDPSLTETTDLEEAFASLQAAALAEGVVPVGQLEDPITCLFDTLREIPDLRKDFEPR